MNDYLRIERIIRYLDESHTMQPDLARLADHVGLSPFHFHRLFSAWAGISPKDFLQCLTLSHAKALLHQGESVMSAALSTGLSGPGRLHDLCVNLEAASPGEMKSGGAGWTLVTGYVDTHFGRCLVAESPRGVCHLAFVEPEGDTAAWETLVVSWPGAQLHRDDAHVQRLAKRIFISPDRKYSGPALRAYVRGTAFQVRVWRALLKIPPGTLVSYGHLAALLGKPGAARAVGGAVGKNPLAFLIPCHRVIRETGVMGDYRWGRLRKCAIMIWESRAATDANGAAKREGVGIDSPSAATRSGK